MHHPHQYNPYAIPNSYLRKSTSYVQQQSCYLNDSTGNNTSSSSPSSNNSSNPLHSSSYYGLDLSHNLKNPSRPESRHSIENSPSPPITATSSTILTDIRNSSSYNNNINTTSLLNIKTPSNSNLKNHLGLPPTLISPLSSEYSSNSLPPKKRVRPVPQEQKDTAYFEKRARNNESAKRSRDARRQKEQQIQERVCFLEHENFQLKTENAMLRHELQRLHAFYPK
ncbi:unnamed protein product [Didymodactylos carnosus]|uniref:BZIP domain-containing protein n=1 Tax=Didymodactylos carnosus TaxID=1234261 RepID=A0A814HJ03_9BILA|nr:unnamed protein product [Didymodactylos carnosus]CAF1252384.1 unnamed protein product [Didymodactylos carnosus]CAF3780740.1 unnamed protein product [Didymodactylos carnosus]CAF4059539.1 unnamed protein product [Didymodactylos carnosus]